ncbi:hypothetical protein RJ640_000686 [Escallonia rubra]|uniref:Reverse transcriptase Ty1/copia-type domain-containing protein n=1 Tax=Escallonia rubra TaxID=112253 RepID=A0AA88UC70_9ASTE|nr:hypothetical protein RJ640_000686 [Escallonia rubra]
MKSNFTNISWHDISTTTLETPTKFTSLDLPTPLTIHCPPPQQQSSTPTHTTHLQQADQTTSQVHLPSNSSSPDISSSISSASASSSNPRPTSSLPTINDPPNRVVTRSQPNIFKPKKIFNYLATTTDLTTPSTYKQVQKYPQWRKAMQDEFDALIKNQTWTLVPSHTSQNIIACKWLFRIKRKANGTIDRCKARLIAKGFTQRPGIDFSSTFSPVVKPTTVRIVLSLAIHHGWALHQLDINNAFLQGHLEEEVFMRQPKGFEHPELPSHVCRLKKAIYGLKQAPHAWYNELKQFLVTYGFQKSHSESSLFIIHHSSVVLYLMVYVDNIILTGNNQTALSSVIAALSHRFSLKDLGHLNYFLGVEMVRRNDGVLLSQSKYIADLLKKYNMHESKGVTTPMCPTTPLNLNDGSSPTDAKEYRTAIGKLQYHFHSA